MAAWFVALLLVGMLVGAVSRYVRPYCSGPVHYEALVDLVMRIAIGVWVLIIHLRYYPKRRAWASLQLSLVGLHLGHLIGWSAVEGRFWDDLLQVDAVIWVASGVISTVLLVGLQWRARVEPGPRCRNCGYLLIGLTEHRCPECGTTFNLSELGLTEADLDPARLSLGAGATEKVWSLARRADP